VIASARRCRIPAFVKLVKTLIAADNIHLRYLSATTVYHTCALIAMATSPAEIWAVALRDIQGNYPKKRQSRLRLRSWRVQRWNLDGSPRLGYYRRPTHAQVGTHVVRSVAVGEMGVAVKRWRRFRPDRSRWGSARVSRSAVITSSDPDGNSLPAQSRAKFDRVGSHARACGHAIVRRACARK
jgi:hypothetical protein